MVSCFWLWVSWLKFELSLELGRSLDRDLKFILNTELNLYEKSGIAYCDSLQIADEIGKRHDHVLRDIENILSDIAKSNQPKFGEINFIAGTYKDGRNRNQKKYLLTKDGFIFLVTSYGGKKATDFKILYIQRFNAMEEYIKSIQSARLDYPALTRAIEQSHEESKFYHFSNEINMINRIVLGMDAKHFKEQRGINKKENSIRPYLTAEQIKAIEELQRIDIGLVVASIEFEKRKELLQSHYNKRILSCS